MAACRQSSRRDVQLLFQVEVGGRDEGVNAAARGRLERLAGPLDVVPAAAGQGGRDRAGHFGGNHTHGLGVGFGGNRKARFDDIHAQSVQLPGQLELLGHAQREARRLLAVAQRGVEDDDTVSSHEASAFDFRIAVTMQSSL